jgi:hypothetical protein
MNGLPAHARQFDTWSGVRITPEEIHTFTRGQGFQLLTLEEIWTQYMWMTCRKPDNSLAAADPDRRPVLRGISNALTGEAVTPASGPMAALSLWVEDLPPHADLNSLRVTVDGREGRVGYIGHTGPDRFTQVNVTLPEGVRTGLAPVALSPGDASGWIRIIRPGPAVPRIVAVTDGVNLISGIRIISRSVKIAMRDVAHPEQFRASVDGIPVTGIDSFCTGQVRQTYEFNFLLPDAIGGGPHAVAIGIGNRDFPPLAIEVV